MSRKVTFLLIVLVLFSKFFSNPKPVQAATYNYCGQVLFAPINGVTRTLLLHCNTTYAVFFEQGLPLTSRTWVQLTNATINFINPYIIYTYNAIPWKIVGTVVAFDVALTNVSTCQSCTTFSPPVYPTVTKTSTRTATKQAPTSTFDWYTLSPTRTPTKYLTTTLTPTSSRTSTPTLTRTTTPTATPEVDYKGAQKMVDLKRSIIPLLSIPRIKTNLIDIPLSTRINEAPSTSLVNDIQSLINSKKLPPKKLDAFTRLVIQEEAYAALLPTFADATSQFVKPMADLTKIVMGYYNVVYKLLGMCKGAICQKGTERLLDLVLKLERDIQVDSLKLVQTQALPPDAVSKIADLVTRLGRARMDRGFSLTELGVDLGLELLISELYLQTYNFQVQEQIDKGVATVWAAPNKGPFEITGTAERARLMMKEITQKAQWADESAQQRYQDFQRTAKVAEYFQDFTKLLGFNIFPPALLVSETAKISRIAVNMSSMAGSLEDMLCIRYLSQRAGEMAFDSQVPGEDCKYKFSAQSQASLKLASPLQGVYERLLPAPWQQQSDAYKSLLNELIARSTTATPQQLNDLFSRFSAAEESITRLMKQYNLQATAANNPGDILTDLFGNSQTFTFSNLVVYISAADISTAQVEGKAPETSLAEAAKASFNNLDEYSAVLKYTDLNPSQAIAMINFGETKVTLSNNTAHIAGQIHNFGNEVARQVLVTIKDGERELTGWTVVDIPPGKTVLFSGSVPIPAGKSSLEANLKLGAEWADSRNLLVAYQANSANLQITPTNLPANTNIPAVFTLTPPNPLIQTTTKQNQTRSVQNSAFEIGGVIIIAVLLVITIVVVVKRKRKLNDQ